MNYSVLLIACILSTTSVWVLASETTSLINSAFQRLSENCRDSLQSAPFCDGLDFEIAEFMAKRHDGGLESISTLVQDLNTFVRTAAQVGPQANHIAGEILHARKATMAETIAEVLSRGKIAKVEVGNDGEIIVDVKDARDFGEGDANLAPIKECKDRGGVDADPPSVESQVLNIVDQVSAKLFVLPDNEVPSRFNSELVKRTLAESLIPGVILAIVGSILFTVGLIFTIAGSLQVAGVAVSTASCAKLVFAVIYGVGLGTFCIRKAVDWLNAANERAKQLLEYKYD